MFGSKALYRELKLSSFVPLNEIENTAYTDKVLVQGIADCVFEEDGALVLVDYKTDFVTGEDELLMGSRKGMAIRFSEKHIRPMGRAATGVRAMKLREGDEIIDMAMIEPDTDVLAITALGYGKRTSPDEYREQGRNGYGIRAMNLTDKTGEMAALLVVHPDEDLLLITDEGTIIRSAVDSIRLCGRYTQGVKLMRLNEGARIIGVARADREEAEPDAAEAGEQPEEAPSDDLTV